MTHPPDSCVPSWAGALRDALEKRPCLRKTRGGGGFVLREFLNGQTRAALGPTASQDFAAVFRAHAFAKPVFSLLFEVRRLLKRKRHTGHPFEQNFEERRIIGGRPQRVKPTGAYGLALTGVCPDCGELVRQLLDVTVSLWRFCGRFEKNGLDCPRLSTRMCVGTAITHCGIRTSEAGASQPFWHCLCEIRRGSDSPGARRTHSAMRIEPSTKLGGAI